MMVQEASMAMVFQSGRGSVDDLIWYMDNPFCILDRSSTLTLSLAVDE